MCILEKQAVISVDKYFKSQQYPCTPIHKKMLKHSVSQFWICSGNVLTLNTNSGIIKDRLILENEPKKS